MSTVDKHFQVNVLTHWIDGSNVYGSDLTASLDLRGTNGKMSTYNGHQLLRFGPGCSLLSSLCFKAG